MTLEDFFTLTEMKNGLTSCARVEELIDVMQKENCGISAGDAARQWSTAASTLASTQNSGCLDRFVHLNGLGVLNYWLREAVKCSRDVIDGEELINTLLGSLNKLPMNLEKFYTSGIFATVERLVFHKDVNIKERAHVLFEKWKTSVDSYQSMDKGSSYPVDSSIRSSDIASIEVQPVVEEVGKGSCKIECGRIQNPQIMCANDLHLGYADEVKDLTCNHTSPPRFSNENEHQTLPSTTSVWHACQGNLSVQGASFIPSPGLAFSTTCASSEVQLKDDERYNISFMNNVKLGLKNRTVESCLFRETSSVPSSSGLTLTSYTKNPTVFRSASCNLSFKKGKSNLLENKEALHRCASADGVWKGYLKAVKQKSCENGSTDLLDLPIQGSSSREGVESISDVKLCNKHISKVCKRIDCLIYETSGIHLSREIEINVDSDVESGEIDALEIARQVAIQVEREVVDYREELCSSSPEVSSNEIMNTKSPSVEWAEYDHLIPVNVDCEYTISSKVNDHVVAEVAVDPSNQDQNMETPNRAAVLPGSICRDKISNFDFDLNEDACTEDVDCALIPVIPNNLTNISAPIPVFASKGAPGFLINRLYFEGGFGWRGSAATSAFRPASLRRTMDPENTKLGSTRKANLIGLDLNLSDSENYLPPMEEVPNSCMPSWNSASEDSSLRPERIKLDINSKELEEAAPSPSSFIKHQFLNEDPSSLPASSSPSPRRPHKNFDLNDNLLSSDAIVSKNVVKTDDPDITYMGLTMSSERRDMGNGFSFDATLATRSTLPYSHKIQHPSFGSIGMAAGVALPFQPAVYGFGNVQQMTDYSGATAFPQMLSSAGANGAALAPSPFLMSITSPASNPSYGGPSHSGLDLNFDLVQMKNGTGEERNLKHLLMLGSNSLTEEHCNLLMLGSNSLAEEHCKTTSQQGISGMSLKRKEPDCSWESYRLGYKHTMSWL